MKKIKLNKTAIYSIYGGVFLFLMVVALYYASFSNSQLNKAPNNEDDTKHVNRLFGNDDTPVVSTETILIRPYIDDKVKVVKGFYDPKGTEQEQEGSIINYGQTYIQNNGISYGGVDGFDVVSSLDGTVISVTEDNLLGKIVQIKCSEKLILIYRSLGEIFVKQNDTVKQGTVIGKSGESNINKDLGSHVVFIIKVDGKYLNPEEYYEKNINEL